jgi:hypothetical protein
MESRWRTRDIEGNLFRQAKSNSKPIAGPPRDKTGTERYAQHLPFQTFCCESGTHVVDPEQSYYRGIDYRASHLAQNMSSNEAPVEWDPESQCMDSTQMWFCRDLWTDAARGGLKNGKKLTGHRKMEGKHKRDFAEVLEEVHAPVEDAPVKLAKREDAAPQQMHKQDEIKDERESGTDMDNMDDAAEAAAPPPIHPADALPASAFLAPNNVFTPARILVNPRCVTTYGGVSHTQLAIDLFGTRGGADEDVNKYVLEDWAGPPDSFVCQEMRTTGGRTAPKSQRRVGWLLQNEVSPTGIVEPGSR